MSAKVANREMLGDGLKSELARYCLPSVRKDANRNLAWMNSICILFLLIGILGSKPLTMPVRKLPPVEEVVPAVVQPLPPPPPASEEQKPADNSDAKTETPQVVVVTPDVPSINFSVPTIGNVLAAASLAVPPPLHPELAPASLKNVPAMIGNTGEGGERPRPPYPQMLQQEGMQGTVVLDFTTDEAGNVITVDVKQSSGYPALDHVAESFIKRHWTVTSPENRIFEVGITYVLPH